MFNKKTLIAIIATLTICLGAAMTTGAAKLSPKQLVINQIKNMNAAVYQDIYNMSSGSAHYEVTKFGGDMLKDYKFLQGTTVDLKNQLNTPEKNGSFELTAKFGDKNYNGQVFLVDDKVIVNKALMTMIAELFPQAKLGDVSQYPEYFYLSRQEISGVWDTLIKYRNQQIPQELKDLLIFLVEAIPDQYFTASLGGVSLQLDQAGFEDVIYNLLLKVKSEKERTAEIITGLATMNGPNPALKPEDMKAQIINSIDQSLADNKFPTKEEIHMIAQFIQVKDCHYQATLLPNSKEFSLVLAIPELTGYPGEISITGNSSGSGNNIKGKASMALDIKTGKGDSIKGSLSQTYEYKADSVSSQMVLAGKSVNTASGKNDLDFEIKGESTQQVETGMNINIPELTASNSMDISKLIDQTNNNAINNNASVMVFVNGRPVNGDVESIKEGGRILVPVRMVSEALGCEVKWIEDTNEVRITSGSNVISMFIDNKSYTVNGDKKQMDTTPVISNSYTFVPVRFVAEALNCNVKWQDPNMVLITTKQ